MNIVSEWLIGAVTKIAGSYEHIKPKLEVDLAESGITTSPSKLVPSSNVTFPPQAKSVAIMADVFRGPVSKC